MKVKCVCGHTENVDSRGDAQKAGWASSPVWLCPTCSGKREGNPRKKNNYRPHGGDRMKRQMCP